MIRPVLDNMREVEVWLEADCSDLDYTVVRPAGLTNNQATLTEFKVQYLQSTGYITKYRIQGTGHSRAVQNTVQGGGQSTRCSTE